MTPSTRRLAPTTTSAECGVILEIFTASPQAWRVDGDGIRGHHVAGGSSQEIVRTLVISRRRSPR